MSVTVRWAALVVLVGALFSMPTTATAQEMVDVTLGPGFIVSANPPSVDAGPTIFSATNLDLIAHNLRVIKLDGQAADNLPTDALGVDETQVNVVASTADLTGGASESTPAVTLAPGDYVLICNIAGHYANLQFVAFQVTGQLPPTATPPAGTTPLPTDTPVAGATPAPTATPDGTAAPSALPTTGAASPADSTAGWWVLTLLGAAGLGLTGLSLAVRRRSR